MHYRFGLIGWPVSHSLSPDIHHAALLHLGLKGDYDLYPVRPVPQGAGDLEKLLTQLRSSELHGLNVTLPHKQSVIPFLDELSPTAGAVEAVNTILLQDGVLVGENTDSPGFYIHLEEFLSRSGFSADGLKRTALILGAGGSARAVVYALVQNGWKVRVAARKLGQAQELAEGLSHITPFVRSGSISQIEAVELTASGLSPVPAGLIVNTTPVGMVPETEASPWPEEIKFPSGSVVYDLVYRPEDTLLVRQARSSGLPATTGSGMLVQQASLAFELWTGFSPNRAVMRKALKMRINN
jgi:shikimate dehydrogenase